MADLIEELVTEILLRLPVKCLLKCLCVCKAWYSLIKSPSFVHLHLNHPSNTTDDYMICSSLKQEAPLFYSSLDNNNGTLLPRPIPEFNQLVNAIMVCGPCNGIFCFHVKYLDEYADEEMFLCNPATRESRRLPSRPLAEPPHTITSACGLGFDPRTNEYKVVSVLCYTNFNDLMYDNVSNDLNTSVYHIGIFTLGSNSWREVSEYTGHGLSGIGLLFDGRLYWKLWNENILWFDIADEVTGHIPSPPLDDVVKKMDKNANVVLLEGCLSLALVATPYASVFQEDYQTYPFSIVIWKRIKESWMKRFSIPASMSTWLYPINCWKDDVLHILEMSKDDLISISLVKEDGDIVTRQKLADKTEGAVIMSKESLVSLS